MTERDKGCWRITEVLRERGICRTRNVVSDVAERIVAQTLFIGGELAYGRLWPTRAGALADAEANRRELAAKGWTLVDA